MSLEGGKVGWLTGDHPGMGGAIDAGGLRLRLLTCADAQGQVARTP